MKCSVLTCEADAKSLGLCNSHYHRQRRYGDPEYVPPPRPIGKCAVAGCGGQVGRSGGAGFCRKHYKRFLSHGAPLGGGIEHGEANRFVCEVVTSTELFQCIQWPYGKSNDGYGRVNWQGKPSNVHAVVAALAHGDRPTPKHDACHSCGNGHLGCVNPNHLYWGTRKENVADAIAHGTARFWGRPARSAPAANDNEPMRSVA